VFDEVFGHDRVKTILTKMVERESMPNALCFSGPDGVGKRLLASFVARALLCETRVGCGTCSHCRKWAHGTHPDFQTIEPDGSEIKVDQIRDVVKHLHYRPFEAEHRILIVDQAERLRDQAGNAFLKSLEEPPAYVHFMLVTSDWDHLLPTIRSRCQKLVFMPLGTQEKTRILESKYGLSPDRAAQLARISLRRLETEEDALEAFDQHVKASLDFFEHVVEHGHALDELGAILRHRSGLDQFLDHILEVGRELLSRSYGREGQPIFQEYDARLSALAAGVESEEWLELCLQLLQLERVRRINPNLGIWFNALGLNSLGQPDGSRRALAKRLLRIRT